MSLYYFENGYYIPFIFIILYGYTSNLFLSTIITLKLFPANYYFHFCHMYNYLPGSFNMFKQFVRFTDTGHLVSFLYYFFPSLICLAFNIHFVITFAYWVGVMLFSLSDTDDIISNLNKHFLNFWVILIHSVPLILLTYEFDKIENKENLFSMNDLCYTYLWAYTWLIFIYLPWRLLTGDPVYNVLSEDRSWLSRIFFFFFIKLFLLLANIVGWYFVKFKYNLH